MSSEFEQKRLSAAELSKLRAFLDKDFGDYTYLEIGQALVIYFAYIYRTLMIEKYAFTEQAADNAVQHLIAYTVKNIFNGYDATVLANLPKEGLN